jgi:large subunit ribosomal protein L3
MSLQHFLGYKGKMTQTLDPKGAMRAVTILHTDIQTVTQVKTTESDGYNSTQIGFDSVPERKLTKAEKGHLGEISPLRVLREFSDTGLEKGAEIDPFELLVPGTHITVAGTSKGKGFQGGVKRHGFKGDKRSHGRKHSERKPGSIGGGGRAGGRVAKGMRMAGRMGGDRITVKGLEVLWTNAETKQIFISGAVPGRPGSLVEVHIAK